jgi:hypothetical protein
VAADELVSRQNEKIAGLVVGLVVVTILVVVTFGLRVVTFGLRVVVNLRVVVSLLVVVSLRVVVDGADLDVVVFSVVAFVVLIVDDWAFCFDKMN